jgi:hypothetical protein
MGLGTGDWKNDERETFILELNLNHITDFFHFSLSLFLRQVLAV